MLHDTTASDVDFGGAGEARREHLVLDPRSAEEMNRVALEGMYSTGRSYKIVVAVFGVVFVVALLGAWLYQIFLGMGVAGLNRPEYWGVYIASYIVWIALAMSGTFISTVLRVFGAEYRRPITRYAELMTPVALLASMVFLGVHVGRTWRSYWIAPYPNQRQIWPNYHSAFLWDEMAIVTYFVASLLYLYLPLIPDMAMVRDHAAGWRRKVHRWLALGWRGTEREWAHLQTALTIMSFGIIPVAFSVHTIVAWDFSMADQLAWHSTIYAPYFVVAAIFSGIALVAIVMFVMRSTLKLHYFLRPEHFDAMGRLLLMFSFAWSYFIFCDYLTSWYGYFADQRQLDDFWLKGPTAFLWWLMIFVNIVVPWTTLWSKRIRRSPVLLSLISLGVVLGMYTERVIIISGLRINRMPFNWGFYNPSPVEISILCGAFCMFVFLYALVTRAVPVVPLWEIHEAQEAHHLRKVGKASVVSVSEME